MTELKFTILLIMILLVCLSLTNCTHQKKESQHVVVNKLNVEHEIEPNFVVAGHKIYYSLSNGINYLMYSCDLNTGLDSVIKGVGDSDYSHPFLYRNQTVFLFDHNGDENYLTTSPELNLLLRNRFIQKIFSFDNGMKLFIQFKSDFHVYYFDIREKKNAILLEDFEQLHSLDYSKAAHKLVANVDNKLIAIDIEKPNIIRILFKDVSNEKLNPFICGNEIYFSSSFQSEYSQIYKISLNMSFSKPVLVYKSAYDIKLPKVYRDHLYYIQVEHSQYLLKKLSLETQKDAYITVNGVVFDYEILYNKRLIYSYTNSNTVKSLVTHDIVNGISLNLTSSRHQDEFSFNLVERTGARSAAYILLTVPNAKLKGVILFIHPGSHSDFSPRWDSLLYNISVNGYVIVAPNYPMSVGFGKTFYNTSIEDSQHDILQWIAYVQIHYKHLPIYLLSSSSGNIIMEMLLQNSNAGVSAAASLFGIPFYEKFNPKIPTNMILGINDPIVNFQDRFSKLIASNANSNIKITSIAREGHWLRKSISINNITDTLVNFFNNYQEHP